MEESKELVGWVSIDVERVLGDISDVVVLENVMCDLVLMFLQVWLECEN